MLSGAKSVTLITQLGITCYLVVDEFIHEPACLLLLFYPVYSITQYLSHSTAFNWKRCAMRTLVCALVVFTGLSVPKFGKILNLVGAATVIPQTFIFPPWFYLNLIGITGEK